MEKISLILFFFLGIIGSSIGQKNITGTVVDDGNTPLIGVNVVVIGQNFAGTLTDVSGEYSITAMEGDTLVFSYIGYDTKKEVVTSANVVDIQLGLSSEIIDEVVVIGYGSSRKSDLTGSVSSISGEELKNSMTTNVDQALQGRIPGVQVTQNSGQPGGAASIRIRGSNSISLSNEPLYVIDGIPFQGDGSATAGFDWAGGANGQNRVNPLSTINPADIVSINVLKDASATAIYGSRGANGVVIITTKRGSAGESKISYNAYYGVQQLGTSIEMMDLQQFANYQEQITTDLGRQLNQRYMDPSILGEGTDWQDEIFRRAGSQSHQLSVTGGNDKSSYAISGGYFGQDGIIIGSNFNRFSTRINLDSKVKEWFKIGGSLAYVKTDERITLNDGGDGVIIQSLIMQPDVAVRDINGEYAGPTSNEVSASYNPVAAALQRNNTLDRNRLMSNFYGELSLMKTLKLRSEIGLDNNASLNNAFHPTYKWGSIENRENRLRQRGDRSFFWVNKNYLTYDANITSNQKLTVLLGQEAQKSRYSGSDITVRNLPSNDIQLLSQGEYVGTPGAWQGASTLLSYYTRLNYNLSEKYLMTFTYRADASSNFGPGNKWGYFPSGSFAWRVSQEDFLKDSDIIDNLKLRVGYGNSGNQSIQGGLFSSLMQSVQTPFGLGFRPARIANPELGWETTTQLNVGVDLSIIRNRIDLTFDVYNKQTKDMLLQTTVPRYLGGTGYNDIASPFINVGRMENKGFDIGLTTRNVTTKKFGWDTNVTFSLNRNLVLELDDPDKIYWSNLYWYSEFQTATTTRVGQPVGQFWGYQTDGLFTDQDDILNSPVQVSDGNVSESNPFGQNLVDKRGGVWIGDVKFKDLNGDGQINVEDQTFIGDPNPSFTYGINNNFNFGPFDATIYLHGSYGADILNYSRVVIEGMTNVFSNQSATVFDRAQYTLLDPTGSDTDPNNVVLANPGTDIPRPTTTDANRNNRMSDRFIENGSYLRIQNVKIGYTIPRAITQRAKISRLKVYFNAQNIYTFTKYSGYDPEIGAFNQSPLLQNVDMGRYPTPRMFTFGLDLDFLNLNTKKMKKYIKYITILAFLILANSCGKDFVTVPIEDRPALDNYYKSETDVKAATATLYGFPWFDFNDKFFWTAGEELAGNLYHTYDQEGQFFYFSYNEGNTHISNGWNGLYRVISYSNAIINDMPVFAEGVISQDVINEAIAEARFMRGTAYYLLSEFWGEVPIVENSTELVVSNNIFLPKNTRESIYEFITRDLTYAIDYLPTTNDPGRVTQWSAKGMLAKTYLTMGQYFIASDAGKSAASFTEAKNLAQDVIDNSGLELMDNYADLFKIEHNNNQESLFAMQWMEGAYAIGNSRQANWARSSIITGNTEAWGGYKSMTLDFLEAVQPGDKRLREIYMYNGEHYPEINKAEGGYTYHLVNRDPNDENIILENISATLVNLKKYVVGTSEDNDGKVTNGQAAAINQYVLRLADVYLIYVEAVMGANNSTADGKALDLLNKVRERAGLDAKTEVTYDELLWERRMEFGLECMYWFDLKRFYYRNPTDMVAMMSAQKRDFTYYRDNSPEAADENSIEGYILQEASAGGTVTFRPDNINLPIPSSEQLANPLLVPGEPAVEYDFN
ncbi:SusC/RagA family TonB-linked outer membrane protein [Portibacter lacus]|uniref:TonB-dependent receptor n=1 Tax=Portibacter lacus TaxID=1099794 RepID=A0AA37WFU8_9BACT|nr:SusC/RagA family TonB-linked outer membrane protein [Portibacter lacus]GLR17280.1 hypothetical protein GCM10007940_18950 [Portibacter lacus]